MFNKETLTTEANDSGFEELAKDRELAEYAKNQVIYSGVFVDPDEIYDLFPPSLSQQIRDPHVTAVFRPDAEKMFLDALGSGAKINIVGYGNDGKNEGVLVKVEAEDPGVQKALEDNVASDHQDGEDKPLMTHITLSIADGAAAYNTRNLEFSELEEPVSINGVFKLFGKDGKLIDDKETIVEMKENNSAATEEVNPDRL